MWAPTLKKRKNLPREPVTKRRSQDFCQGLSDPQTMFFWLLHPQIPSRQCFFFFFKTSYHLWRGIFFFTSTLVGTKVDLEDINKVKRFRECQAASSAWALCPPWFQVLLLASTQEALDIYRMASRTFSPRWHVEDETECSLPRTLEKSKDGFRTALPQLLIPQCLKGESHRVGWKSEWAHPPPHFPPLEMEPLTWSIMTEPHKYSVLALWQPLCWLLFRQSL